MFRRKDYTAAIAAAWTRVVNNCGCGDLYFCPTAGDIECPRHSGFTTCCNRPRRHLPVTAPEPTPPPAPTHPPRRAAVRRTPFTVPTIDAANLNVDDFHPLDHVLAECTGYPGGRRRHLTYQWEFQTRPRLHAATLCRLGFHQSTVVQGRTSTGPRTHNDEWYVWDGCLHCHKRLSTPQPL